MPTLRYKQLRSRVDRLERLFLPPLSPVGSYSADEYDKVRAFIVLCHAEVEAYIETMALDVLRKAEDRWKSSSIAGSCIASLMLFNDKQVSPPKKLSKQSPEESTDVVIKTAIRKHREYAQRDNHGIKETNLLRLLLPIGFQESDFDSMSTWLGTMNSFGVSRGLVAHQSANRVQNPPDPSIIRQQVSDVLNGIVLLEPTFARLRRR
ncbi:HEPN domain-containing protein [[Kitasatospora] papulosa]|uniref:HEPN domain-containing protein n=1 Tax=[Kitasatospora] papulosa TaxID=1464011 RepID=UPI0039081B92